MARAFEKYLAILLAPFNWSAMKSAAFFTCKEVGKFVIELKEATLGAEGDGKSAKASKQGADDDDNCVCASI